MPCIPSTTIALAVAALAGTTVAAEEAAPNPAREDLVRRIRVTTDKAPDCSSLKAIVRSVTRDCETNDAKAVALYNAGRLLWYHHAYPGEEGGISALKMIHVYGYSLCGGQHTVLAALWRAAGWDWRYIGWKGHTTVECRYDGRWHYFDTFLKVYAWRPEPGAPGGRTVASQADILARPELIADGFVFDRARKVWYLPGNRFEVVDGKANWRAPAFFVCGDKPRGVIGGVKTQRVGGTSNKFGHMGLKFEDSDYSTDVNLPPGASLELRWSHTDGGHWHHWKTGRKHVPRHSCGDKDYRNCPAIGPVLEPYRYLDKRGARTFSNGTLRFAPSFDDEGALASFAAAENARCSAGRLAPADASKPASVTVRLASPYVMVRGKADCPNADKVELSTDAGATWQAVDPACFDDAVSGHYECLLRLTFSKPLRRPVVEVLVQHNRCALPYLSPGPNKVTVSVAEPNELGDSRVAVTYAYALGQRSASYEALADRGAEVARAHKASWSDTPTVVQKVFAAADLPGRFDIPVPTPKGAHPVYPRMLFLRREVLAPGQEPSPPPAGAAGPRVGNDDELKTLPNPFTVGLEAPPKRIVRPSKTRTVPLKCSHVIWRTKEGKLSAKTFANHHIKTRPKSPEAWVMLIGGTLDDLPPARDIKAARLCIPVVNSNPKAPTQVGASLLEAAMAPMKPFPFDELGEVLGTAVVAKMPGPGKAKVYKLDVTRGIKAVAAGERAYHGFAVRVLPNRAIDNGWTVRIDITRKQPTVLELEVHTDAAGS